MDTQLKVRTAGLAVISNAFLITLKLVVGFITGSIGILADAVHSGVDLLASGIALLAVRVSGRPPDESHAYGHGKYENISGTIEAILIIGAAILIGRQAVLRIVAEAEIERIGLGMGVTLFAAALNWVVSARVLRVARQTDSIALEADAHHLRLDAYSSIGVFAALLAIYITGLIFIDGLIGIALAIWIASIGIRLSRRAVGPLLDLQLPMSEVECIVSILHSHEKVLGFHKLRTRKSGPQRHIDVHLVLPDGLSLTEAHDIAEEVEDKIRDEFDNVVILTHVEPDDG